MSLSRRKHSVYQKIKRQGLYFRPYGGWYRAPWMKAYCGRLVYACGSIFSTDRIHIFEAETGAHLGEAALVNSPMPAGKLSQVHASPYKSIFVH